MGTIGKMALCQNRFRRPCYLPLSRVRIDLGLRHGGLQEIPSGRQQNLGVGPLLESIGHLQPVSQITANHQASLGTQHLQSKQHKQQSAVHCDH